MRDHADGLNRVWNEVLPLPNVLTAHRCHLKITTGLPQVKPVSLYVAYKKNDRGNGLPRFGA
jgi:hypothetical protein